MDGEKKKDENDSGLAISLPDHLKTTSEENSGTVVATAAANAVLSLAKDEATKKIDEILANNPNSAPAKIAKNVLEQPWGKNKGVTPTFVASAYKVASEAFSSSFVILMCLFGLSFMAWGIDISTTPKMWYYLIFHSFFIVGIFRCLWLAYAKKKDKVGEAIINLTNGL